MVESDSSRESRGWIQVTHSRKLGGEMVRRGKRVQLTLLREFVVNL